MFLKECCKLSWNSHLPQRPDENPGEKGGPDITTAMSHDNKLTWHQMLCIKIEVK